MIINGVSLILRCKEFACNAGDPGLIPESGRDPGETNGYPQHYSSWRIPWTEEPGEPSPWGHKSWTSS